MRNMRAFLLALFVLVGCAPKPVIPPTTDIYRKMACDFAYGSLGFQESSAVISAISAGTLSLVVEASQRCPTGVIRIVGLSDAAEDSLSHERVSALREYMKLFGVTKYEFVAKSEVPGKMELQWVGQDQ